MSKVNTIFSQDNFERGAENRKQWPSEKITKIEAFRILACNSYISNLICYESFFWLKYRRTKLTNINAF